MKAEVEDTSFVVNVRYLPQTIMSDAEYKTQRDRAVKYMTENRLATKGVLVMQQEVNELEFRGVPSHQIDSVALRQFERQADYEFAKQFDSNCLECPHRKMDVCMDRNNVTRGIMVRAKTLCGAKLNGTAHCFDGYMPGANAWLWPDYEAVDAKFRVSPPNEKGLVFATLELFHDRPMPEPYDPREMPSMAMFASNVHDEPPGYTTRQNVDGAYLTSKEIKLIDRSLAGLSKMVRATLPSPQPQTPCEDAW